MATHFGRTGHHYLKGEIEMRTIIEMAHEVGFGGTASEFQIKAIERFVDLIRADEREAILKLADSLGWVDVDYIKARGNK